MHTTRSLNVGASRVEHGKQVQDTRLGGDPRRMQVPASPQSTRLQNLPQRARLQRATTAHGFEWVCVCVCACSFTEPLLAHKIPCAAVFTRIESTLFLAVFIRIESTHFLAVFIHIESTHFLAVFIHIESTHFHAQVLLRMPWQVVALPHAHKHMHMHGRASAGEGACSSCTQLQMHARSIGQHTHTLCARTHSTHGLCRGLCMLAPMCGRAGLCSPSPTRATQQQLLAARAHAQNAHVHTHTLVHMSSLCSQTHTCGHLNAHVHTHTIVHMSSLCSQTHTYGHLRQHAHHLRKGATWAGAAGTAAP